MEIKPIKICDYKKSIWNQNKYIEIDELIKKIEFAETLKDEDQLNYINNILKFLKIPFLNRIKVKIYSDEEGTHIDITIAKKPKNPK